MPLVTASLILGLLERLTYHRKGRHRASTAAVARWYAPAHRWLHTRLLPGAVGRASATVPVCQRDDGCVCAVLRCRVMASCWRTRVPSWRGHLDGKTPQGRLTPTQDDGNTLACRSIRPSPTMYVIEGNTREESTHASVIGCSLAPLQSPAPGPIALTWPQWPKHARALARVFHEGSCWIPGSWMCRWRPTPLLSPHPPGISSVSMVFKMRCASRTPLE